MKHLQYTLLFLVLLCSSSTSFASPGDTTIISTSSVVNGDNSVTYDSLIVFPTTKTYRKILLVYTINTHVCPAGSTYCHQWDGIAGVGLKAANGDSVELARAISPFANLGWSRFPAPPAWFEDFVYDVTDFAPFLKDSFTISTYFSGTTGFGVYTKLIYIEGTPDRNTIGITPLYSHGGTYGSATNPIDSNFPVLHETAPPGTASAAFRFIVTGHGSDVNQCCEFAEHYYNLYLNGTSVLQQNIFRDCGLNELYPQGGTWIYNRSNWCPGASVVPYYNALPGVSAGTNYTINVGFEPYTVASPSGAYITTASMIYYGGMNKTLDASIDDIIAPSSSPQHFRENPANNLPTILLHNSGSTTITSASFQYGVADSAMQSYTWNGSLPALADTIISLPALTSIAHMSATSQSGTFPFIVAITGVNGTPDADQTNDTMRSQFIVAPNWPDTIVVKMLTSNLGADGESLNTNPADASWYITDVIGDTVFSVTNTNYSTLYTDTIALPANGYYKFIVSTPANCTGLHWWAYDQSVTGYAPGYLLIKKLTGANLPMHGYTYTTTTSPAGLKNEGEHDDFGCSYSQYFYVSGASTTAVNNVITSALVADIYPNPANKEINIDFDNANTTGSSISVVNVLGQTVYSTGITTNNIKIDCSLFSPGFYTILCNAASGGNTNIGKIVVAH